MNEIHPGDKVVCVDDSDGTQSTIKAYTAVKQPRKKLGQRKAPPPIDIKVPAILVKGKTYKVTGIRRPPHDTPDRPLIQVELPMPYRYDWWACRRFQKKGK